jgi:hypothetical protein
MVFSLFSVVIFVLRPPGGVVVDVLPDTEVWQHRTIASSRFDGSFPPILRFEKLEIHTVFLRFSNLALTKNLSPNLLAELCGVAVVFLTANDMVIKRPLPNGYTDLLGNERF